jgi:hypothetical protein
VLLPANPDVKVLSQGESFRGTFGETSRETFEEFTLLHFGRIRKKQRAPLGGTHNRWGVLRRALPISKMLTS